MHFSSQGTGNASSGECIQPLTPHGCSGRLHLAEQKAVCAHVHFFFLKCPLSPSGQTSSVPHPSGMFWTTPFRWIKNALCTCALFFSKCLLSPPAGKHPQFLILPGCSGRPPFCRIKTVCAHVHFCLPPQQSPLHYPESDYVLFMQNGFQSLSCNRLSTYPQPPSFALSMAA